MNCTNWPPAPHWCHDSFARAAVATLHELSKEEKHS